MSGLTLYASQDLAPLAGHYVDHRGPDDDPLAKRIVVVPNVLVGQWFEQEVARRTGRPGRDDGVAANFDTIFLGDLLGRLLYGDAAAMERWSGPSLGVELYDLDRGTSLADALRRGEALARLVALRSDELDSRLAAEELGAERRLIVARARNGHLTPQRQFDESGVAHLDEAGERLTLFGCLASSVGPLAALVARAVADVIDVDLYVAVPARELFDHDVATIAPEERSLLERWGAPASAQLGLWRGAGRPDRTEWIEASAAWGEAKSAVAAAVAAKGARNPPTALTPFVEVHRTTGLARQVEVARDALLRAMDELGVPAHGVRVVSADPEAVVALLATYWQPSEVEEEGSPRLQFEVADPGVRRRSARVDAFLRLLRAVDSPLTVHDVAGLLGEPALLAGQTKFNARIRERIGRKRRRRAAEPSAAVP